MGKTDLQWGGVTTTLLNRITALELKHEDMQSNLTDFESRVFGLSSRFTGLETEVNGKLGKERITQSRTVTEPGWAVDARELNAAFTGTIANQIQGMENLLNVKKNIPYTYAVMVCNLVEYAVTTGIPAPQSDYNVVVSWIDLYGSRLLTAEELGSMEVVRRAGSFEFLTRNLNTVKVLTQGRLLIVGYNFV